METFDVIICGAGPAGSIAAKELAKAGLKTALIEKDILPRHKTCGGGMPMVIKDFIKDVPPQAFVESNVKYFRHTWLFSDPFLAPLNPPCSENEISLFMVQRSIFDNVLAQNAVKVGAQLFDGVSVYAIEIENEYIKVNARLNNSNKTLSFETRYLIGADGANGIIARLSNLHKNKVFAGAIEIEYPHKWGDGHPDLRPDIAHLEYGAVKNGYAWVFPKAEHLNIGAGFFLQERNGSNNNIKSTLQKAVFKYLDSLNIHYDPEKIHFYAHPIPVWNGKETLHTSCGRILLVGDAARLVNPFFGDGILYAIKSGIIAANCIVENSTSDYTDKIYNKFGASFNSALILSKLFYRWAGLFYQNGVKRENTARVAARLLCGEITFDSIYEKALERIKQVAPSLSLKTR